MGGDILFGQWTDCSANGQGSFIAIVKMVIKAVLLEEGVMVKV